MRGGKVYTALPEAEASMLIPILPDKVLPDSIVETDSWEVYGVWDIAESPPL